MRIIQDYCILELTNKPNGINVVWRKKCKVSFPTELLICNDFDTNSPIIGKAFNIRQVKNRILADISVSRFVASLLQSEDVYVAIGAKVNSNNVYNNKLKQFIVEEADIVILAITKYPA